MVNLCQWQLARLSTARCVSCRTAVINIVVCRAVSQQAAATDGHQPFVCHFSLTCPLINTSVRRNLPTMIVFDKLVVKGEQAAIRAAVCDVDAVKFK